VRSLTVHALIIKTVFITMNLKICCSRTADEVPEFLLEVLDFVRFLKTKHPERKLSILVDLLFKKIGLVQDMAARFVKGDVVVVPFHFPG